MATQTAIEKQPSTEIERSETTRGGWQYQPPVDIFERRDELIVLADMPGVRSDDINVQFENGQLTIYGKVSPRGADRTGYLLHEFGVGDFYRSFTVSQTIDSSRISAEYRDGALTLHLPKADAAKPRKINVKAIA